MKYQAHIRHINGDIITVIWDDDWDRFMEEVELAKKDIVAYLGDCDFNYTNAELFIEIV
jgi:hypothetical protein